MNTTGTSMEKVRRETTAANATDPRMAVVRRLCKAICLLACAEFVVATTGVQIQRLPNSTDFATYYLAGAQTRDHASPYDHQAIAARGRQLGFDYEQFPFLYPPPFALAVQPLAQLSYPRARQIWMLIATLALLVFVVMTASLMRRQSMSLGIRNPVLFWTILAAFVPAALNSTSVHNDLRAGSVGILLGLALTVAAWSLMLRRTGWLAVALGLAALIKLTPVFALPYAAWRGANRAASYAAALLVLSMLPALFHWGWSIVPDYIQRALLTSLGREFPLPMNQSLDALLSRLFVPGDVVHAPFEAPWLKHVLSAVLTLWIVALTLRTLRRRLRASALQPVELGYLVIALLIVMKITWVHTLTAMLFVWPVLMLSILRAAEVGATWARSVGLWACVGFFLSSAHIPILWQGLRQGGWVLGISVHLLGLFILWCACGFVLQHEEDLRLPGEEPA